MIRSQTNLFTPPFASYDVGAKKLRTGSEGHVLKQASRKIFDILLPVGLLLFVIGCLWMSLFHG
ncbi:MAG TPA: hypothetical protein VII25_10035, partial [Candidatus Acidoferrum sp.]